MIRPIVRDPIFLAQKSTPAAAEDLEVVRDLRDTLRANRQVCVGMAANMIGYAKRIIIFTEGAEPTVLLNPEILKHSGPYEAQEGCLCHDGTRRTKRYRSIKLRYQDEQLRPRVKSFSGYPAQIIQHELDHLEGILI